MEKQSNHEYGQTDPDFIDQNTLIDGNQIHKDDQFHKESKKENQQEFGESDPDYVDQNTPVDNDNYARDEDPYQYQEEFIEDLKHPKNDFETNEKVGSKNIQNQEQVANKDDTINGEKDLPNSDKK